MLTQKHLTLIRAALRYFDEEFSPHGAAAYEHYVPGESVTADEVASLRSLLDRCELRYVRCPPDSQDSVTVPLLDRADGPPAELLTVIMIAAEA